VLVDESRLAELMIEFGVAVATDFTYTVKRIDNDFLESIQNHSDFAISRNTSPIAKGSGGNRMRQLCSRLTIFCSRSNQTL
jgi:hypothetical protein